jgi:transcriptional regulator with XRE-family HTH domain
LRAHTDFMDRLERVSTGWAVDREAAVAKSVSWLRRSRGITQRQLGADLFAMGFGMNQATVAKLEAGAKHLRLNEIAAIATYFEVPLESLWLDDAEALDKIVNERLHAAQVELAERMTADYYTRQRVERLRDK